MKRFFNFAALLPGFLTLNSSVFADASGLNAPKVDNLGLDSLALSPLNAETPLFIASHRSHSSHRSHRSHSSHRSSSGGGYYPAPTPPALQPVATPSEPVQRYQSQPSSTQSSSATPQRNTASMITESMTDAEKRKRLITRIQISLYTLGYYNGAFDGVMGPIMRESIKKYRADKLLPQKDVIDIELLNSLGILAN